MLLKAAPTEAREIYFAKHTFTRALPGSADRYKQLILSIVPGDVLVMSDGTRFTIEERLGMGFQNVVFTIREAPHLVLRIPYKSNTRNSTVQTLRGYQGFEGSGLRVVSIHPRSNAEYVLAERLTTNHLSILDMMLGLDLGIKSVAKKTRPNASDLLAPLRLKKEMEKARKISQKELSKMEKAFIEFTSHVGEFIQIQDIKENQIFYDRDAGEWILVDWLEWVIRLTPETNREYRFDPVYLEHIPRMLNITDAYFNLFPTFKPDETSRLRLQRIRHEMQKAIQKTRLEILGIPICGKDVFD